MNFLTITVSHQFFQTMTIRNEKEINPQKILVFAGRLTYSKWADLLCQLIRDSYDRNIHIHIFGEWEYAQQIKDLEFQHYTYHGQQPIDIVHEHMQHATYVLVPSRFLETFWLTALDAVSRGTPVIVRNQWWLKQFWHGFDYDEDFVTKAHELIQKPWYLPDLNQYSKISRLQRYHTLFHWNVLHVSDYLYPIWGIEVYVQAVSTLLSQPTFWLNTKPWSRIRDLIYTSCNFYDAYILSGRFKGIDIIWIHSFTRRLWLWPLIIMCISGKKLAIMYHDFGLFCAYPDMLTSESQLNDLWKWKLYKKSPPWWLKYCINSAYLFLIKKHVSIHLVPSEFMQKDIQRVLWKKVDVFPHFIL